VAKATGPAGHVRSATYAPQLDVTTATDPASTATFGYDPAVNGGESLTSTRSATGAGNSSAYGTTPDHQVPADLRHRRPGTASTYTYNGAGNRMSASSAAAAQAIITRDPDGTVATSTSPTGAATSYFCDDPGQLTSTTPPTGTTLGERSYTHDGYVRVATYTSGRGVTAALRRPRSGAGGRLLRHHPDRHPHLRRPRQHRHRADASGPTDHGHDPLGGSPAARTPPPPASYSCDKAGNLATATHAVGTTRQSCDTRDRVTRAVSPSGRSVDFAHAPPGRRTDTRSNVAGDGYGATSFAAHTHTDYDASGRITRVWTSEAGTTPTGSAT
jgi:YD repeat-containing protein